MLTLSAGYDYFLLDAFQSADLQAFKLHFPYCLLVFSSPFGSNASLHLSATLLNRLTGQVFARQARFKVSPVLRTNIATKKKILQLFKGHYGISLASIRALDDTDLINKARKTFQNMF